MFLTELFDRRLDSVSHVALLPQMEGSLSDGLTIT